MSTARTGSSFRDPSGFLYHRDGVLLRQVNASFSESFDTLLASGLRDELVRQQMMVDFRERPLADAFDDNACRVLEPDRVPWVSYPYEWTPSQLRGAALLTIRIQALALRHGMVLRDASAFNVQFIGSRPVFIDTLSFDPYVEGVPWIAYGQFCRHFLAPLALQTIREARLRELSRAFLDGIPLDLASELLPRRTRLRPSLLAHVHLHARSVAQHGGRPVPEGAAHRGVSRRNLEALVSHLESAVDGLRWRVRDTEWANYTRSHGYSDSGIETKTAFVRDAANTVKPTLALDLGANTGRFSDVLVDAGAYVVAMDSDVGAVELLARRLSATGANRVLPLWVDLTNPAPAQGWAHAERSSLAERGPADLVLALALIHHLAIGNNVPLVSIAEYFARIARHLVIEWVPKDDPQVQRLLVSRPDVFPGYTQDALLAACEPWFRTERSAAVADSGRVLYLMARR